MKDIKMIQHKTGDLLNDEADALVNAVNCVGVMGKGIALQFKSRFPGNFQSYSIACRNHEIVPGKMFVYRTNMLANPRFIINFPTKNHWRDVSRIEYIQNGLDDLARVIDELNIKSIAIPRIGCGLGGLDWQIVRPLIEAQFANKSNLIVNLYH